MYTKHKVGWSNLGRDTWESDCKIKMLDRLQTGTTREERVIIKQNDVYHI